MLLYALRELWNNRIARYGLLFFSAAIIVSFIFSHRFEIYTFFSRIGETPAFDKPRTYAEKPYGFREDAKGALKKTHSGLKEILKLAEKTYNSPGSKYKKVKTPELMEKNWAEFYTPQQLELVASLFEDMQLFCPDLRSDQTALESWSTERKQSTRTEKLNKHGAKQVMRYAVTKDNFKKIRGKLLKADSKYFYPATEKKPDAFAVLLFREELRRASCLDEKSGSWWLRALNFKEYKQEQQLYYDSERKITPEELHKSSLQTLFRNPSYLKALREAEKRISVQTGNLNEKLNENWRAYTTLGEERYLLAYIDLLRRKSMRSSKEEAAQIFQQLYAIQAPGIETSYTYLLALAETAYRSGEEKRGLYYLEMIDKQGLARSEGDRRYIRRMLFSWNLVQ